MRAGSLLTTVTITLLAAVAGGCGTPTTGEDGRLVVVATTSQLADFTRNVGGERVSVTQLLPAGGDPHDFEPTPRDVDAIARSAVVIENGAGLDGWLGELIANAGNDPARVVATADVAIRNGDPHVWLDPRNAVTMVRAVAAGLGRADPRGAADYRAAADRYVARIREVDRDLVRRIAAVPPARRRIVTDHDALGYFANRYGITVVATVIPSQSAAAEPDAKAVAGLKGVIERSGVRAVFAQGGVDERLLRAVAAESGVRLGAPLYTDSLGPGGSPAGTYLGMMRSNMDAIIDAVGSA